MGSLHSNTCERLITVLIVVILRNTSKECWFFKEYQGAEVLTQKHSYLPRAVVNPE